MACFVAVGDPVLIGTESVGVYCHFGGFEAVPVVVAAAAVDFDYPEDVMTFPT